MKQLNLPFKIDKQYENWQFELDALDDRLPGYHSYSYIGEQLNYFLNYPTDSTELIFNGDYLTGVVIIINNLNVSNWESIVEYFTHRALEQKDHKEFDKDFRSGDIIYRLKFYPKTKTIQIVYGKWKFILRAFAS